MPPINRREALKLGMFGGALLASGGGLGGCARERRPPSAPAASVLSAEDRTLMEDIADTLLPTTAASPGARAAGAGAAIDLLLTDCYEPAAQRRVVDGLRDFRATCRARTGEDFAALAAPARERLLREVDAAARAAGEAHWFHLARELALRSYFSSEIGMTRALRYVRIPGRWIGCMPLRPGQPAWG
jgi:hypothetical protein